MIKIGFREKQSDTRSNETEIETYQQHQSRFFGPIQSFLLSL